MAKNLKELLEDNPDAIFFPDTCIVGKLSNGVQILDFVANGIDEFMSLEKESMQEAIDSTQELSEFVMNPNVSVISEVLKEMERHSELINQSNSYWKNRTQRRKIKKKISKSRIYEDIEEEQEEENSIGTEQYGNALYHLIRISQRKDSRMEFTPEQTKIYSAILDLSSIYSRDMDRISHRSKTKLPNPGFIGESLQTDKHLIASAITTAYRSPSMIITGDNGLSIVLGRVCGKMQSPFIREKSGLNRLPKFPVMIYNPQFPEEGTTNAYDPRFPLIYRARKEFSVQ